MKYWQTQHFKALQQAWYQRLEDSGFEDAEELVDGEMELKQNAEHPYRNVAFETIPNVEDYYSFIRGKIHEESFRNEIHREVLTMFADGVCIKGISQALKANGGKGRCTKQIRAIIRRYEMNWGIRIYTRQQLGLKRISA